MVKVTCHCGNIVITADMLLESITSCNCSMCYRLGALWAYYTVYQVDIKVKSEATVYLWGSKVRSYHSCTFCGCTTHYTQKRDDGTNRVIGSQSTPEWLLLSYLSPLMLGFSMVLIPLNMLSNRALNKSLRLRQSAYGTLAKSA